MKKKIIILGGNIYQKARKRGLFVISLDNRPENKGHIHSDKYYNISTVNKNDILQIAEEENISAITSAASDIALPTIISLQNSLLV